MIRMESTTKKKSTYNSAKVSVVLCTYNGEKYLREQLDSILSQTYLIFEIIIQDDCSTDNTWSIIEEYKTLYPSLIKPFRNDHNIFWIQNYYQAILKSSGDYIALSDQDDIWAVDKIEKQVSSLVNSGKKISVCSHYYFTDERKSEIIIKKASMLHSFFYPQISGHLLLFHSSLKGIIYKGVEIDMAPDMFLGTWGIYYNSIVYLNELLVKWRRHNSTATSVPSYQARAGINKVRYALSALKRKEKSLAISRATQKHKALCEWLGKGETLRKETKLMELLSQQTICSYIKASCLLCTINDKSIYTNIDNPLKSLYSKATFLFRWWYIHKESI